MVLATLRSARIAGAGTEISLISRCAVRSTEHLCSLASCKVRGATRPMPRLTDRSAIEVHRFTLTTDMTITQHLAEEVARSEFDDLPMKAVSIVKQALMDDIGVAMLA